MLSKIISIIEKSPGIKAKPIAKQLGVESKTVNSLLYDNPKLFVRDEAYCWSLVNEGSLRITFAGDCWIDSELFEDAIKEAGSPLDCDSQEIIFVIPQGCKMLLEAAARLMAMANQLVYLKKRPILDFTASGTTVRYLERMGYFEHLSKEVTVIPERTRNLKESPYKGSNTKVVEFAAINPNQLDESIPNSLRNSFVAHTDRRYFQPAFTILAELLGNVRDHSKSPINGFVALQCYKKGRPARIQTVISDSGAGIVGTLRPILATRYPDLAKRIESYGKEAGPMLVKEIFENGRISSIADDRGLGIKASGDAASKFNAKILLRLEDFEVTLQYKNSKLHRFSRTLDLPRMLGTHICFDFLLD